MNFKYLGYQFFFIILISFEFELRVLTDKVLLLPFYLFPPLSFHVFYVVFLFFQLYGGQVRDLINSQILQISTKREGLYIRQTDHKHTKISTLVLMLSHFSKSYLHDGGFLQGNSHNLIKFHRMCFTGNTLLVLRFMFQSHGYKIIDYIEYTLNG